MHKVAKAAMATVSDIRSRAEAIRLDAALWAERSGVHDVTIRRLLQRGSGLSQTVQALETALVAEEQALLAHLLRLHPAAAGVGPWGTVSGPPFGGLATPGPLAPAAPAEAAE